MVTSKLIISVKKYIFEAQAYNVNLFMNKIPVL